jgi:hypothetical protein
MLHRGRVRLGKIKSEAACVGFVGGVASLFILRRIANKALPTLHKGRFISVG